MVGWKSKLQTWYWWWYTAAHVLFIVKMPKKKSSNATPWPLSDSLHCDLQDSVMLMNIVKFIFSKLSEGAKTARYTINVKKISLHADHVDISPETHNVFQSDTLRQAHPNPLLPNVL